MFFSRVRARRIDYCQTWRTRILQTISWRTDEQWGARFSTSAISPLDLTRHFRMGFNADYLLNDDFTELENSFSIFDELSARSAMLYEIKVQGDTDGATKLTNTILSASYRREIHKHYMFAELVPELAWPRENNFKITPAITLQIEMILGVDD